MTSAEAIRLLGMIKAAWPYAPLVEETVALYVEHLQELDYESAREGVARLVDTSEFPPTVAAIRKAAATVALGLPTAVEAFAGGDFGPQANALVIKARALVGDQWCWRTTPAKDLQRRFDKAWEAVTERAFAEACRVDEEPDELAALMPAMQKDLDSWGKMP